MVFADAPRNRIWAPRKHAGRPVPLAWVALLRTHAALTRPMNTSLLAHHDLTLNDYEVLLHLSWAPERRLCRIELARRVHLTASGVTRLLHGLQRAGLVTSRPSLNDRRAIDAQLTSAGGRKLAEAAQTHVEDVDAMFTSRFSRDELAMLAELLGRLTEAGG